VQCLDPVTKNHIRSLVEIETKCFPPQMQESEQDFEDFLEDEYAVCWILYRDNKIIGYLLGSHISELNSDDILATNKFFRKQEEYIFYLSSIAILKEERSTLVFDFLFHEMAIVLKSYDYYYIAAHVRINHGFSSKLQHRFKAAVIKTYDNWNNYNEPFDYLLIDMAEIPTLPGLQTITLS
jgi:hypothetical protein